MANKSQMEDTLDVHGDKDREAIDGHEDVEDDIEDHSELNKMIAGLLGYLSEKNDAYKNGYFMEQRALNDDENYQHNDKEASTSGLEPTSTTGLEAYFESGLDPASTPGLESASPHGLGSASSMGRGLDPEQQTTIIQNDSDPIDQRRWLESRGAASDDRQREYQQIMESIRAFLAAQSPPANERSESSLDNDQSKSSSKTSSAVEKRGFSLKESPRGRRSGSHKQYKKEYDIPDDKRHDDEDEYIYDYEDLAYKDQNFEKDISMLFRQDEDRFLTEDDLQNLQKFSPDGRSNLRKPLREEYTAMIEAIKAYFDRSHTLRRSMNLDRRPNAESMSASSSATEKKRAIYGEKIESQSSATTRKGDIYDEKPKSQSATNIRQRNEANVRQQQAEFDQNSDRSQSLRRLDNMRAIYGETESKSYVTNGKRDIYEENRKAQSAPTSKRENVARKSKQQSELGKNSNLIQPKRKDFQDEYQENAKEESESRNGNWEESVEEVKTYQNSEFKQRKLGYSQANQQYENVNQNSETDQRSRAEMEDTISNEGLDDQEQQYKRGQNDGSSQKGDNSFRNITPTKHDHDFYDDDDYPSSATSNQTKRESPRLSKMSKKKQSKLKKSNSLTSTQSTLQLTGDSPNTMLTDDFRGQVNWLLSDPSHDDGGGGVRSRPRQRRVREARALSPVDKIDRIKKYNYIEARKTSPVIQLDHLRPIGYTKINTDYYRDKKLIEEKKRRIRELNYNQY